VKERFSATAELIEGSGGVFKVWWDGRLLWDKRDQGRFPENEEILAKLGSAGR
jgi:selenoprotein W-related protein